MGAGETSAWNRGEGSIDSATMIIARSTAGGRTCYLYGWGRLRMGLGWWLVVQVLMGWVGCVAWGGELSEEGVRFFETSVRPVLVEHCYSCHSVESGRAKGGLQLDTREGLLRGGDSGKAGVVSGGLEESLLVRAIRYDDPDLQMPPKEKLGEGEIAALEAWILMGAPDPRDGHAGVVVDPGVAEAHWAFQVPERAELPGVVDEGWVRTEVDRFILAGLEARGMAPVGEVDRRAWIRRATFDLHGLPPTVEEVRAFEEDGSEDAFERLVDRLLASPRYGERWGRHWLDVARYADTKGYVYDDREEPRYVHSHAYRDWVIRALNEDMPYDRFLELQVAADQVVGEGPDLAAMGFLTLGRRFLGVSHDIIDDRIDVVTRGMLGLTVACARCHDHKFDPVPAADYYSLYGVFDSSTERLVPVGVGGGDVEFERGLAERVAKFDGAYREAREVVAERIRKRTTDYLVAQLTVSELPGEEFYEILDADALNPIFVRRWQAYLLKRAGVLDPVFAPWHAFASLGAGEFGERGVVVWEALKAASGGVLHKRVVEAFDRAPVGSMEDVARRYGELFEQVMLEGGDDAGGVGDPVDRGLWAVLYGSGSPVFPPEGSLADTQFYFEEATRVNLGKLFKEIESWHLSFEGAPAYAGILEDLPEPREPRVFRRGNPGNRGEVVPRQFLGVLAGEGRKPFERGSGRLELARAIADRGNPLTARVMVNRVWMHHFGRGLVTSPSDFGVRSEPPSHPELLDYLACWFMDHGWSLKALHRLIMTSSVYRLGSEVGEGVAEVDPENRWLSHFSRGRLDFESMRDALLAVTGDLDLRGGGSGVDLFKAPYSRVRSVYGLVDRTVLPGVFRAFDFANPDLHIPQRHETTVPQQALYLLNSPFMAERARSWVERLGEGSTEDRVRWLYRDAFQREPSEAEVGWAREFVEELDAEVDLVEADTEVSPWSYGYGMFDLEKGELEGFVEFPHFTGEAWQGGGAWPDSKLGWLRLTAEGGHPGEGLDRVVVRRWVAPRDVVVSVRGTIRHAATEGDGVRGTLIHSKGGVVGQWPEVHHGEVEARVESVTLAAGEWLDFVVDHRGTLSHDDFLWAPVVHEVGGVEWDAVQGFGGPEERMRPLGVWEALAQVILLSNEFVYVD